MNDALTDLAMAGVVLGLALSTLVTRASFLVAGPRLRLAARVEVALRYAPVCTLSAIIVPDVLLHGGQALELFNPRLVGALAAGAWLCWSRNLVGCLATGMAAYTLARLYLQPALALAIGSA
jgi:branched-subunit amino acid transport protein